jgi:hypothetical protein
VKATLSASRFVLRSGQAGPPDSAAGPSAPRADGIAPIAIETVPAVPTRSLSDPAGGTGAGDARAECLHEPISVGAAIIVPPIPNSSHRMTTGADGGERRRREIARRLQGGSTSQHHPNFDHRQRSSRPAA